MNALANFHATAPMPAVARILARFERDQLAGFIAVAIDLLDTLDGDPEDEDNADREASDGDDQDQAYVEWTSMRGMAKRGSNILAGEEDDEEGDPDTGVEDGPRGFDPESDYGDDEAGEGEQMANDVPTVPCFAIEPDGAGKRAFVGYWNPSNFMGDHRPA